MTRWFCEPVVRVTEAGHVVMMCTCGWRDELGISPTAEAVVYSKGRHDTTLETRLRDRDS